ncbi:MAG: hypothetical protein LBF72_01080 [Holosporales bacterium]|jgi:hypothetical protein|nr:hypothetical protein [Holosporales bacterium]
MEKENLFFCLSAVISVMQLAPLSQAATEPTNLPRFGLEGKLDPIMQRLNDLWWMQTGQNPASGGSIYTKSPNKTPLRFEFSGNKVVKMVDKFCRTRFIEVIRDDSNGGLGRYEDEAGTLQEVKWGHDRVVFYDSYVCHSLLERTVPAKYEEENEKSLLNMIGSASSVLVRNGSGGVIFNGGSVSERLNKIITLCDKIIDAHPSSSLKEFSSLKTTVSTGLSLLDDNMKLLEVKTGSLEQKIRELNDSVDNIYTVLERLLCFIKKAKIVTPCTHDCGAEDGYQ